MTEIGKIGIIYLKGAQMSHLADKHLVLHPRVGLGRIFAFDPRDQKFPLGAAAPLQVDKTSQLWETPTPLNQGQTYECTAYSAEHLLLSGPIKNPMYLTPHELYHLNQLNDEFPGEAYSGSSVRAAMKVLQAAGLIGEYAWAFDADTARRWVLMRSPVVLGTNWYSGMEKPDKNGFIRATGTPVGGHAYMVCGADDTVKCPDGSKGAFRILNSWGVAWGKKGTALISYKDVDGLIKNQGECVTPTEICCITAKKIDGVVQ